MFRNWKDIFKLYRYVLFDVLVLVLVFSFLFIEDCGRVKDISFMFCYYFLYLGLYCYWERIYFNNLGIYM